MIEEFADPALPSPLTTATADLSNDEGAFHQPAMAAVVATLTELCLYILAFYAAFVSVANRWDILISSPGFTFSVPYPLRVWGSEVAFSSIPKTFQK